MKNFEGIEIYHRAGACKRNQTHRCTQANSGNTFGIRNKKKSSNKTNETRLHFQAGEIFSDLLETKNKGFPVRKTSIPHCIRNNNSAGHFCFTQTQKQQTAKNL